MYPTMELDDGADPKTAWRVRAAAHIDQNGLFYAIRVSVFLPEVQLL